MPDGRIAELTRQGLAAAVRLAQRLGLPHLATTPHWQDGFAISLWDHCRPRPY